MRFATLSLRTIDGASRGAWVLGLVLVFGVVFTVMPVQAQTIFTVTNTNDAGTGSLRQAILDANATANGAQPDEIHFDIDVQTDAGCDTGRSFCAIAVQSVLPSITEAVVIDGETQAGATCGPDIPPRRLWMVLRGSGPGGPTTGLEITSSGSTVKGLVINQFDGDGILLTGAATTDNLIVCN